MTVHDPLGPLLDDLAEGEPCGGPCDTCRLFRPMDAAALARLGAEVRADAQAMLREAAARLRRSA